MSWISRQKLFNLAIVFLSLFIGLIIADFVASYFVHKPTSDIEKRLVILRETVPNGTVSRPPSKQELAEAQHLEDKNYITRTDSDGFIIGSRDIGLNSPVSIIFFGGSTTKCEYVEEDYRFPYLVGSLLKDKAGNPIRTLNGGVVGNHSLHSLINMVAKGLKHRPKFVVLMHNINDLTLLTLTGSYWDAPESRNIVQTFRRKSPGSFSERIFEATRSVRSILFPDLSTIFRKAISTITVRGDNKTIDEWVNYRGRHEELSLALPTLKADFKSSITSFVRTAKAWGIEPVLMTQFNRLKVEDEFIRKVYEKYNKQGLSYVEFVTAYSEFNQIIRDVSREEGVFLIDLDKEVEPSLKFIYDAVHLNSEGSKRVSEIISTALAQNYPNIFVYQ